MRITELLDYTMEKTRTIIAYLSKPMAKWKKLWYRFIAA